MRKRLLIIVDWFAPGYKAGGPIQSCVNLAHALKEMYDVFVITSDMDHSETHPYPNIKSNKWLRDIFPGVMIFYIRTQNRRVADMRHAINSVQPDIVYLNHLYSPYFVIYPLWLKWRNLLNARIVLCPRGALATSALKEKAYKKKPYVLLLRLMNIQSKVSFHATNADENDQIKRLFAGSHVTTVNNIPGSFQGQLTMQPKRPGFLKCIFVARIVPIKNLLFLLQILQEVKAVVELEVIGPDENKAYFDQCLVAVARLPKNITVQIMGSLPKETITRHLKHAHLLTLPTAGENFGHSIFEAFAAGRPVLISDQTPWKQLQEKNLGWSLPLIDKKKFSEAVEEAAAWDQFTFDDYCRNTWRFAESFMFDKSHLDGYKKLFS